MSPTFIYHFIFKTHIITVYNHFKSVEVLHKAAVKNSWEYFELKYMNLPRHFWHTYTERDKKQSQFHASDKVQQEQLLAYCF